MNEFSGARHGTLSRFLTLADAVRSHEIATAGGSVPRRPRDHELYRRLSQLEQSLPIAGGAPSPSGRTRFQVHGH